MITKHLYKDAVWVDLDKPTKEEIDTIVSEYGIDPSIARELSSPSVKPKLETQKNFIYFVIHFPVFKHSHTGSNKQEIDFIIGKNYIITARYDTIDALYQFSKKIEVEHILNKNEENDARDVLFFGLMKEMYQSMLYELEYTEDWLADIEKKVFAGKEREMVFTLSKVSRNLLDFKRAIEMHSDILKLLEHAGRRVFSDTFVSYVKGLEAEYQRVTTFIRNNTEIVTELRETNNSLLTTKQNQLSMLLALFAFVAVLLGLILSLLQIDTKARPIVGAEYDFWILVGILVAVGGGILGFFRWKKLL